MSHHKLGNAYLECAGMLMVSTCEASADIGRVDFYKVKKNGSVIYMQPHKEELAKDSVIYTRKSNYKDFRAICYFLQLPIHTPYLARRPKDQISARPRFRSRHLDHRQE